MVPYETLLLHRAGAVVTVTLNRPERHNALSSQLLEELSAAMTAVRDDPDVRAVVLTGAGTSFCAGLDLRELGSTGDNMRKVGPFAGLTGPWPAVGKPVIGAANGPAATGGLELALHCDLLIAAEGAAFADTHARVGVLPGWGLTYLLPQAVGVRRAREMSLTGRMMPAAEAHAWGLVNHVVPADELLARARALAAEMAEVAPEMAAELLDLYRETTSTTVTDAIAIEARRSAAWADAHFRPELVGARSDGIIARGRTQA
ncbi:enoyl-CoA hydratase [Streptomyces brasiliensis]|uniref:Enoyl-CoA hydratase n=1 Tax=Streptomyces brasiliensis TaxID=1954 RepID=A0A917P9C7_9ACTN|nr:enoyl-CoA hydratase [Streptomyces brasiliensis]GGJ67510.1 putative enoyl-CoA hydratase [Streptomyces brasiliensis]